MMKLKKTLSVMLAALLVVSLLSVGMVSQAANEGIGEGLSWSFDTRTKTLTVSGTGEMNGFNIPNYIRPWWFHTDKIKKVIVQSGVFSVGARAFQNCDKLTSVTLADSVVRIGRDAFSGCTALTSVQLGSGLTQIESCAFEDCTALTSIELPAGLERIGGDAFRDCSALTSVTLPNDAWDIYWTAFRGCSSLKKAVVPAGATDIRPWFPALCEAGALTEYAVDSNNAVYSSDANGVLFNQDKTVLLQYPDGKTQSYTIPDSVTCIGAGAFAGCENLLGIVIPDTVAEIQVGAFSGAHLVSVALPVGVEIGIGAFNLYLQDVYFAGSEEEWNALSVDRNNEPLLQANIHFNGETPEHFIHEAKVVKENAAAPSCTENGGYDEVTYCAVCGEEFIRTPIEVRALGHDFSGKIQKNDDGTFSYTCVRCGERGRSFSTLPEKYCKYCYQEHTGFFGPFVQFIHNILYFFKNLSA